MPAPYMSSDWLPAAASVRCRCPSAVSATPVWRVTSCASIIDEPYESALNVFIPYTDDADVTSPAAAVAPAVAAASGVAAAGGGEKLYRGEDAESGGWLSGSEVRA